MEKAINGKKQTNNPGAWSCDCCGAVNTHGKAGSLCGCGESRKRNQPAAQPAVDINSIELTW